MNKINQEIFKAYDIRGVYNIDFDDNFAYQLGLAFSQLIREEEKEKAEIKIAVGSDMRLSSPKLKENLINGLLDGGAEVIDIGLSSTPTLYFSVAQFNYDGGINITASHNPKDYNGFKLTRAKAMSLSNNTGIFKLREMIINGQIKKAEVKGELIKRDDILENQVKHDLKFVDITKLKHFKIVIDPANAMGALYFDELFKHLDCQIIKMNWQLDGTFPAHEADPLKPENMEEICVRVKAEKADLGIATDGDGDRIFFVDNAGEAIQPGIIRAILAKIFLKEKPGAKIAYDIRPGRITEETIRENGGQPIITPVGHSLIKLVAIKENAYFAGESSGHFFLNMKEGIYEIPMIVTLKILNDLSNLNLTMSEYIKPYKRYFHSGEINNRVDDKEKVMEIIKEKYKDGKINLLDGVSIEYPDFWFNVRPSNTEPLLRFALEARTKEIMEEKRDEILKLIK
ncbi:MAG: phosphomannomutase/phosphoglucomutase [Patescibacteria group bacterium]